MNQLAVLRRIFFSESRTLLESRTQGLCYILRLFCRPHPNIFLSHPLSMVARCCEPLQRKQAFATGVGLPEGIFIPIKNLFDDTISRSLVNFRITAGLVDNDQSTLS